MKSAGWARQQIDWADPAQRAAAIGIAMADAAADMRERCLHAVEQAEEATYPTQQRRLCAAAIRALPPEES